MRVLWDLTDPNFEITSGLFNSAAKQQMGNKTDIYMSPGGFFFRQKADPLPLANCRIENLEITEHPGKCLFDVKFTFASLHNSIGEEHTIQIRLKGNGECCSRPRFSAMALNDGFVMRDAPRFNRACTLYMLIALSVMRGSVDYHESRSGWQLIFSPENKNHTLAFAGVTLQDADNHMYNKCPLAKAATSRFSTTSPPDPDRQLPDAVTDTVQLLLHQLEKPALALIWAFVIHSVTARGLRILNHQQHTDAGQSRCPHIYGNGIASVQQIANIFCPAVWRKDIPRNLRFVPASSCINLARVNEKLGKFDSNADGSFFVLSKKTGTLPRTAALKKILKKYESGESLNMPIFLSCERYEYQEFWCVDAAAINIDDKILDGTMQKTCFTVLISYIQFVTDYFRWSVQSDTPTDAVSFQRNQAKVFSKLLRKNPNCDPEELDFGESLYFSSLWFTLFLDCLNWNWKTFDNAVKKEITARCVQGSEDSKVLEVNISSEFCRWVLDMFETRRSKFSGIMWEGVEKRRNDAAAFYLEGKPLENAFFRATGFSVTLDLRNTLTLNGILLRRTHQSSVVQERKPPAEVCAKFKDRLNRNGKASVWVLSKDAVLRYAEKS